uniref:Transposase n=1 Tax=Loa loa TaxID=7209 RepID=A0A1I7VS60_LOALO
MEIEGILKTLIHINFDDYQVIQPIDFISPNAHLQISSDDDDNQEYTPYKINTRDKLVKNLG